MRELYREQLDDVLADLAQMAQEAEYLAFAWMTPALLGAYLCLARCPMSPISPIRPISPMGDAQVLDVLQAACGSSSTNTSAAAP